MGEENHMATKLDTRAAKKSRLPDGKRLVFDRGQAKTNGSGLPLKTTEKE